jgi:hypothetical protein
MSQVRFEPTILVFELAKTVHALYRAATVIAIYTSIAYEGLIKVEKDEVVPVLN